MRDETRLDRVFEVRGFFTEYKEQREARFNLLFPDATADDVKALDYLLIDTRGERVFIDRYAAMFRNHGAQETVRRIVSGCDMMCFSAWLSIQEKIKEAAAQSVSTPYTERRTTEQTQKGTDSGKDNEKNKVFAFDSESANDESEREASNERQRDDELKRTVTVERSSGTATENAADFIDFTRHNDFLEMMFDDIVRICAKSLT